MDRFLIAYSKLIGLKENLPDELSLESYYVDQYHSVLEAFKDILGDGIDEFTMEVSEVKPVKTSFKNGAMRYSNEKRCDRAKLLVKIDSLINYLVLTSPKEQKEKIIGFRGQQDVGAQD